MATACSVAEQPGAPLSGNMVADTSFLKGPKPVSSEDDLNGATCDERTPNAKDPVGRVPAFAEPRLVGKSHKKAMSNGPESRMLNVQRKIEAQASVPEVVDDLDDGGRSRSSTGVSDAIEDWSQSSVDSEPTSGSLQELLQNVPLYHGELAPLTLVRASARAEDDCDERPVTDWLTSTELQLLQDDLAALVGQGRQSYHYPQATPQAGNALPFAARHSESTSHRKRRSKMSSEWRYVPSVPPPPVGRYPAEKCSANAASASEPPRFVASQEKLQLEAARRHSSTPPEDCLGEDFQQLPNAGKETVTYVVDEHKIDLLNEESGDDAEGMCGIGRAGRRTAKALGCGAGCAYWNPVITSMELMVPWLRATSAGRVPDDDPRLIRL